MARTHQLLRTKLFVPAPRANLVSRPRLTECLNEGLDRKLVIISAPAGFGKTTLLGAWVQSGGRPTAWVSLDKEDNDPVRFWTYFIEGARTLHSQLGETTLTLLQSPPLPSSEALLTGFINEIAEIAEPFVLVLDDFHVITNERIHEGVSFLLEHLPPSLHLILASRTEPPLSLSRRRVRNELVELRADDLRFTSEETASFLSKAVGVSLPSEEVSALEERTEGWIAGLQMAAISLRGILQAQGPDGLSKFIKGFTGSNRLVLDYLLEEVITQQSALTQEFLFKTSILERMTAPLCDAVTGGPNSQTILAHLEQDNLFLVPLDGERQWYRYHHLFRGLLSSRLEQALPGDVPALHCRASEWYEATGLVEEAVTHAFAAQDLERAARLVNQFADQMNLQTNQVLLSQWIERLPHDIIRTRPWLCVYEAWVRQWTGQRSLVEESLRNAELALESPRPANDLSSAVPTQDSSESENEHIAGHIAAIRAHHALIAEDLPLVLKAGQKALELLPEEDYMRSEAAVALGGAHWGQGNSLACQESFQLAKTMAMKHNHVALAVSAACYVGMIQTKRGLVNEALESFREGLRLATTRGGKQLPIAGFPNVKLGDLMRERNNLDTARHHIDIGAEQCVQLAQADVLADSYVAQARLALALGDIPVARQVLDQVDQVTQKVKVDPFVMCWLDDCHVRLWLSEGDLDTAVRWARESGLKADDPLSYHYDLHHLNLARVLVAQGTREPSLDYLQQALGLLERLKAAAEKAGWVHEWIKIQALRALALKVRGNNAGALEAIEQALIPAEKGGYVRLFVDEGAPMLALLSRMNRKQAGPEGGTMKDFVGKLLSAFPAGQPNQDLHPSLSARELQVLRLLAAGKSNQEIADQLVVAIGTVKKHTSNIFDKLGVQTRTECAARAHELHLL